MKFISPISKHTNLKKTKCSNLRISYVIFRVSLQAYQYSTLLSLQITQPIIEPPSIYRL